MTLVLLPSISYLTGLCTLFKTEYTKACKNDRKSEAEPGEQILYNHVFHPQGAPLLWLHL